MKCKLPNCNNMSLNKSGCCSSKHTRQYKKLKPFINNNEIDLKRYLEFIKTIYRVDDIYDLAIEWLIKYAEAHSWNTKDLKSIFVLWKQGYKKLPFCNYEGCKKQVKIKKNGVLSNGCCLSHSQKVNCFEKNGFESYLQQEEIKIKIKHSIQSKYGVEYYSMTSDFKIKSKKTFMTNYGVSNPMKHSGIKAKFENVIIEKYGVRSPLQNSEICEKQQNNRYKTKEYVWKTGEISKVQGYENILLSELENKGYKFQDILTRKKDMPEIWYEFDEKRRRYFPDIFIPKENLIIEVKSTYTIVKDIDRNELKWTAAKKLGYDFRVEVR